MIAKPSKLIRYLQEQNQEQLFEVKIHREKRSLNANAYLWVLCGKIAEVIKSSKEEVYFEMLKAYGQSELIRVHKSVNLKAFVRYAEVVFSGEDFDDYLICKGSSEYDTREMACLIDGVISECQQLDIETIPEDEIARLKNLWNQS